MRASSFIASKLKQPRRFHQNARPIGHLTVDKSHPNLAGCQHLWTGVDMLDGYVTELRDQIGDLHLPQENDVDNDVVWDASEGAVVMEDNQNGSWLATAAAIPSPINSGSNVYELSVSAWFKTNRAFSTTAQYYGVLGWGERSALHNHGIHILEQTDSTVDFVFEIRKANYTNRALLTLSTSDANSYSERWVHIAGVQSGNQPAELYLDGQLMAATKTTETSFVDGTATNKVFIGKAYDAVDETWKAPFPGKLRDLRFYNRCIGAAEAYRMARNPWECFKVPAELSTIGPLWLHPELVCTAGAYTDTGTDAHLLMSRLLTCTTGTFSDTGHDADLLRTFLLTALPGTYTMTGHDIGMFRTLYLEATSGVYNDTGHDLEFEVTRQPISGLFVLTITPANGTISVRDVNNTIV